MPHRNGVRWRPAPIPWVRSCFSGGIYPSEAGLAARDRRDEARARLAGGIDPLAKRYRRSPPGRDA